jgi:hypothetical protein
MQEEVLYEPSPVQQEAHDCPADEVLYGGTAGPGKSVWLRWDPFINQIMGSGGEHDRYLLAKATMRDFRSVGWALHVRKYLKQLRQTIEIMKKIAEHVDPASVWHAKDDTIEMSCGYRIEFGHLEHEDSWRSYDSNEYTHLAMDEATQLHECQFDGLRSRVRCVDPVLRRKLRVCLASNPDSPVCGRWVKKTFVDPAPVGRTLLRSKLEMFDGSTEYRTRMYIPAFLSDNPNPQFRRDYEKTLRTLPRHLMRARLMCDWNVLEGAFFEYEWIPSVHVVKPYKIPDHYPKFRVLDWGYKTACPVTYWAVTEDEDLVCFRELTFNHEVTPRERKDSQLVAMAIRDAEKQMGFWDEARNQSRLSGPADYQIREERDGGWTIEDRMAAEGVYWVPCHKNRLAGTSEFLRRLKDIPTREGARPGVTFFNTCHHTIRTIPMLPVSKTDPEVPEDGGEDHWYDTCMYACMYRAPAAVKPKVTHREEWETNDLDRARARAARRYGYGS